MEDSPEKLAQLIKSLDKISPDLWSKALLHVRIESVLDIVVSLAIFVFFAVMASKAWKKATWDEDLPGNIRLSNLAALALLVVTFSTGITFTGKFVSNIADIVSPEGDAVEELLESLKDDGAP